MNNGICHQCILEMICQNSENTPGSTGAFVTPVLHIALTAEMDLSQLSIGLSFNAAQGSYSATLLPYEVFPMGAATNATVACPIFCTSEIVSVARKVKGPVFLYQAES